jgi:hypothetical protein
MNMNKAFDAFIDRIMKLVYIFAPDLYRTSEKTKVIIAFCTAIVVIAPIVLLARSCSSEAKPTGYSIKAGPLTGKDQAGNQWVVELIEGQPKYFYSSRKLKPGPPLLVSAIVELKGLEAFIGLEVKGQAGEKYAGGALKNGKQVEAPTFDIVDEGGKLLASGQFKYG